MSMSPVSFFEDCISYNYPKLLFEQNYTEFWLSIQGLTSTSSFFMALDSIAFVLRQKTNLEYNDVGSLMKLASFLAKDCPEVKKRILDLFPKPLSTILISWIMKTPDEVCSFLQEVSVDQKLPELSDRLAAIIIKDLSIKMATLTNDVAMANVKRSSFSITSTSFDEVKKLSYCIESLAEGYITKATSEEFVNTSKIYLAALDSHIKYFSGVDGAIEEVIWAFGRRSSWMIWHSIARKRELERSTLKFSGTIGITIEAHTTDMLIKNDWNLFFFCAKKKNFRDGAATLCRIWINARFETVHVCREFAKLKQLLSSSQSDSNSTLYNILTKQLQLMELYSSEDNNDAKKKISGNQRIALAMTEMNVYQEVDKEFFKHEIEYLKKVGEKFFNRNLFKVGAKCEMGQK